MEWSWLEDEGFEVVSRTTRGGGLDGPRLGLMAFAMGGDCACVAARARLDPDEPSLELEERSGGKEESESESSMTIIASSWSFPPCPTSSNMRGGARVLLVEEWGNGGRFGTGVVLPAPAPLLTQRLHFHACKPFAESPILWALIRRISSLSAIGGI